MAWISVVRQKIFSWQGKFILNVYKKMLRVFTIILLLQLVRAIGVLYLHMRFVTYKKYLHFWRSELSEFNQQVSFSKFWSLNVILE